MPPMGPMGVVTALRDAADLAKRIVHAGGLKKVGAKTISDYESEMRKLAKMAIRWSWQAGLKSFGLRPIEECEIVDL
jgi:2-polyprenyl-6-methoxyphenol hydroxylase-like FAD-dependent oxidoreductase